MKREREKACQLFLGCNNYGMPMLEAREKLEAFVREQQILAIDAWIKDGNPGGPQGAVENAVDWIGREPTEREKVCDEILAELSRVARASGVPLADSAEVGRAIQKVRGAK